DVLVVDPLDLLDREAAELLALEERGLRLATGLAVLAATTAGCHVFTSICLNLSEICHVQHEHRAVPMPHREEARQLEPRARPARRDAPGIVAHHHQLARDLDPPRAPRLDLFRLVPRTCGEDRDAGRGE